MEPQNIVLILTSVLLGIAGQLFLKQGTRDVGKIEIFDFFTPKFFSIIFHKPILIGILLYAIATLLWLVILSKTELSLAYPMLAIGYVIITITGKFLFNENVSLIRIIGILLISLGTVFLMKS